jgi:hypothetical protein
MAVWVDVVEKGGSARKGKKMKRLSAGLYAKSIGQEEVEQRQVGWA